MSAASDFQKGDRVFVHGEPEWQGAWDEVPVIIEALEGNEVWVRLEYPVRGWAGPRAFVPIKNLSKVPLEDLIREKLGDDYL